MAVPEEWYRQEILRKTDAMQRFEARTVELRTKCDDLTRENTALRIALEGVQERARSEYATADPYGSLTWIYDEATRGLGIRGE